MVRKVGYVITDVIIMWLFLCLHWYTEETEETGDIADGDTKPNCYTAIKNGEYKCMSN